MESRIYKDMSLFDDIENPVLRSRNRGVVMSNICLNNVNKNGRISHTTSADLLTYFSMIPKDERKPVLEVFLERCKQEGYRVDFPRLNTGVSS